MSGSDKTLVIHSGTYKTGSSAIQLYLARAEHNRQLGDATYPMTGRGLGVQHANLTAEIRGGDSFTSARGGWERLLEEVNQGEARTTVISSENFASFTPEQLDAVGRRTAAAGVQVRWIHYVREQSGFFNAFYVERLVAMRPEFADLIDLPVEDFATWSPLDLSILDYATFADQVRDAVPGVDLRLRPFARAHLVDGDVVADFCATAAIAYSPGHAVETNVGTGWRTVEAARRLTPLMKVAGIGERVVAMHNGDATRLRWIALIRSALVTATEELGWNDESAMYLTAEFREQLLARYAAQNERVAEIGGFDWPAIVAAEKPRDRNIGSFDDIPASEYAHVVQRVVPLMLQPPEEIAALLVPAAPRSLPRRAVGYMRRKLS